MKKTMSFKMCFVAATTLLVLGCSNSYKNDAPQVSADGLELKRRLAQQPLT